MSIGRIKVICGGGEGKTSTAIGMGVRAVSADKKVIVVQFLKGNSEEHSLEVFNRLEPEMSVFRFEKYKGRFSDLSGERKAEELNNIKNGMGFVRKVLTTGSCDVLILDEILGLIDRGIIESSELEELLENKPEEMEVIMTGTKLHEGIKRLADSISRIEKE